MNCTSSAFIRNDRDHFVHSCEFFLNNTILTFLAFLNKIDIQGFQNEQNIKLFPVGIELTNQLSMD